ncbi:hypothetical protein JAAARDRAFT_183359 [Jaapia argillacea MUCL 33604]|uniref:Alcohol dehydrogenase-like N-terminal domain-containing protein n=1 Tax=Jaapia argillacea MUCL 33604 TaxID=933084 RepID=A0A067PSU9_9AGAM|nr:hypothetical protein JAAARDRAFT_183359 [Jaapia argillacea MUCL 33604]
MASQVDSHPELTPGEQLAVKWYPPAYDIRVESVPIPTIQHRDDAIVKVKLAGLCGSDLHIYRGHGGFQDPLIFGHEFIGEVISLGESFTPNATDRPSLYPTLKVGDKVVSAFTSSCGECHFCRVGFTSRCVHCLLFGIPILPGGQAQYVRVPKAGGTLFAITGPLTTISEPSLVLLADILPTGIYAALQVLQHPKIAPVITGVAYPFSGWTPLARLEGVGQLEVGDRELVLAVVGLGPVGVCATIALLDMLASTNLSYKVIAIDPNESRRLKMQAIYEGMEEKYKANGQFKVEAIEEGKKVVEGWTNSLGCNAVLEIVGNNSALTLALSLVRPFGLISSVGVHQAPPLPFTGRECYNKNVSFDFGRCPVRSLLPVALDLMKRREDVFGAASGTGGGEAEVGGTRSLVDKIVPIGEAKKYYEMFDKGECGKVLFDPWV